MAPINNRNKLNVKCIVPGRDTIKTPINPIKTAKILLGPTFSFRIKKEKIVKIKGALNKIG